MSSRLRQYAQRFDTQSTRERGLIALTLIAAIGFIWWNYYAEPMLRNIEVQQAENRRIGREIETTRATLREIRRRIAAGVHQQKETQLARLSNELSAVEERLRIKTIELIDPEMMFDLMNQLVYRDSQLKLLSLKRREVRPAIPPLNPEAPADEAGIYRHVLEIKFAGKYLDILRYMQSMEALDWKLLWDEIEIISEEHPKLTVKLVMSTLSTRKEWVGI